VQSKILITIALSGWMTTALSAQAPSAGSSATTPATAPTVHLEGCLYPPAGNQSTSQESKYIIENLTIISHRDGSATPPARYAIQDATNGQEQMKALAGRRVGVTGRVVSDSESPELAVVAIREIVGQCAPRALAP